MKLFLNNIILFALPIIFCGLIMIGSYIVYDPFKVIYKYEEFNQSFVDYNVDYVVTERYLRNKNKYNSFIFGSSRAGCGFDVQSWGKILQTDEAFSFACSNESIFGIYGKLKLIDEEDGFLKNVLLVIDTDATFSKYRNSTGHLYIKHPLVSGESWTSFSMVFLKDYVFRGFFVPYLDFKLFAKKRNYMDKFLKFNEIDAEKKYIPYDISPLESKIQDNEEEYFNNALFYDRDTLVSYIEKQITNRGQQMLEEINLIFKRHNTKYKIVISPLYDQKRINNSDLSLLIHVFGIENVFDYSGRNIITIDKHNYYETSHYRKRVGDLIIEEIYNNKENISATIFINNN